MIKAIKNIVGLKIIRNRIRCIDRNEKLTNDILNPMNFLPDEDNFMHIYVPMIDDEETRRVEEQKENEDQQQEDITDDEIDDGSNENSEDSEED